MQNDKERRTWAKPEGIQQWGMAMEGFEDQKKFVLDVGAHWKAA